MAQDNEVQLANQYLLQGEKEKALVIYEKLSTRYTNIPEIHTNYFNLLLTMQKTKEAEKYLQNIIRHFPSTISYRIDLGYLFIQSGRTEKGEKYLRRIINENCKNMNTILLIASAMSQRNIVILAEEALQTSRECLRNERIYSFELASLYRRQGNLEEMANEYLNFVVAIGTDVNYAKSLLQNVIRNEEELMNLKKVLLRKVQTDTENKSISDLLIWVNLQQKDFYQAFINARAYDKKFQNSTKTLEVAQIAFENKEYDVSEKAYRFVLQEYTGSGYQEMAEIGLLESKKIQILDQKPVSLDSVKSLVVSYTQHIKKINNQNLKAKSIISKAKLQAYYVHRIDSAIVLLENLLRTPLLPETSAEVKLELADLYLIDEKPWESTLLLSQVEKSMKESNFSYEAKLKNARLSYFKGEFSLALEHLDILKQATTREIANDAMKMSILIKENIQDDSVSLDLKMFAKTEWLLLKNRTQEALDIIKTWKAENVNTEKSIKYDILMLEAKVLTEMGDIDKAIENYRVVVQHSEGIHADDALYLEASLLEKYKNDTIGAMEKYRKIIEEFPGSKYVAQSRKRFRYLRGD